MRRRLKRSAAMIGGLPVALVLAIAPLPAAANPEAVDHDDVTVEGCGSRIVGASR
ncbi:hypothetical protein QP166_08680 [Sphingomonas sp. LR60]